MAKAKPISLNPLKLYEILNWFVKYIIVLYFLDVEENDTGLSPG